MVAVMDQGRNVEETAGSSRTEPETIVSSSHQRGDANERRELGVAAYVAVLLQ